jgi:hypothetical protein
VERNTQFETDQRELVVTRVYAWEGEELKRTTLEDIAKKIAERAKELGVKVVYGDQREEAGIRALLLREHIRFKAFDWSDTSKDEAVQLLRRMMREEQLHIVDHEPLRRELTSMKARLQPSGRVRYESNGLDYASAVITLAHAVVAGDVFVHTDWEENRRINARIHGVGSSPFEPPLMRHQDSGSRFGGMPGRGFG